MLIQKPDSGLPDVADCTLADEAETVKKKKARLRRNCIGGQCRGGQIRTDDLLVPNQARYRATLRPELLNSERKDTFYLFKTALDLEFL